MDAYDRHLGGPAVAQDGNCIDARSELRRLLADPEFHCTERNKRFLEFISEELFAGRQTAIKAYTVAVDVFGRSPDFDPSIDPIVRIEATRLRTSLSRYYELHGREHDIHIDLPRGRYIPNFVSGNASASCRPHDQATPESFEGPILPSRALSRLYPSPRRKWIATVVGLGGGLLLGVALVAVSWWGSPGMVFSDQPTVAIRAMAADAANDEQAAALRDALVVALSRFQTLSISSEYPVPVSKGSAAAENAAIAQPSKYLVTLKYDRWGTKPSIWWQVIDRVEGRILESDLEVSTDDGVSWTSSSNPLILKLANEIAGRRGIIGGVEAAADWQHPTLGDGCILRAQAAVDADDRAALEATRKCLSATLDQRPNDSAALAALAAVLLPLSMGDTSSGLAAEALEHANRAVALQPDSPSAAHVQMLARYYNGQPDSAIFSGRRASELNPFDISISADLGSILFLVGHWDEGISLISQANRISDRPLAGEILAFNAYRQGSYAEVLRQLQDVNASKTYLGQLLTVATLARLGRMDEASANIAILRRSHPDFENSFSADMAYRSIAPSLVAALKYGLEASGLRLK